MAITSFQLLLTATTLGIAAWAFVVDSPKEEVAGFENKGFKLIAAVSLFFSTLSLLLVIIGMWLAVALTPGLGSGGAAFYWVLLAITVATLPKLIQILILLLDIADEFKQNEKRTAYYIIIPYTLLFILALSWGLTLLGLSIEIPFLD